MLMPRHPHRSIHAIPVMALSLLLGLMSLANSPSQLNLLRPSVSAVSAPIVSSTGSDPDSSPTSANGVFEVNSTSDSSDGSCQAPGTGNGCTLREAIAAANTAAGADLITFAPALTAGGPVTITVSTELPSLSSQLTISGPGANLLTIQRSASPGTPRFRIFNINQPGPMTIAGLTITNGLTEIGVPRNEGAMGAGILNNGTLTLINLVVTGNITGQGGDGQGATPGRGGAGGGIANFGSLVIVGSTISSNSTGTGGNGTGGSGGFGGGIANFGIVTLTNCTISNNNSGNGSTSGPAGLGGGMFNGGSATLSNSTVANNKSGSTGPSSGGGHGGGIHRSFGTINLQNTIVAHNSVGAGASGPDLFGEFNSQDYNLIENVAGATFTGTTTHNVTGLDPLLGPLANNGGPTLTHALLPGSPAFDSGNNASVANPPFSGPPFIDQRGFNRIVDGSDADTTATVDIGAYEKQPTFPDLPDFISFEDLTVVVAFDVLDSGSITSTTATSSNTTLVPNNPANINVTGTGPTRVLTIVPVASLFGTSDIEVTVNRTSGSESSTFTLTVNSVNDAPSFTKGADESVNENSAAQTVNNWATNISPGPLNEAGQTLAFQVTANTNSGLFLVAPAISQTGTLTYTPAPGVSGTAAITVALMDNGGIANGGADTSATQTFNINVLEGGSLQFSNPFFSSIESGGAALITVTRTGGFAGAAQVNYATSNGTATAEQDYTATSGTLNFPNGVTTQTFSITINNDTTDEPLETVNLTLSNPTGTGALGAQSTAVFSIDDNDPLPGISINDVSVAEGDSGTTNAVFTVTLSAASSFTATASFTTFDGLAGGTSDYVATNGLVTFSPGEVTKTISVVVNGDTTPEVHENFFVNLSNATNSTLTDAVGIGTILSDDAQGGALAFNLLHSDVGEGAGFATIVLNRTGDTSAAVTVDYTTLDQNDTVVPCSTAVGHASSRCDFTPAPGTLRLSAGDASKSFIVLINQDNFVEGSETLGLMLSNPTGGAVLNGSNSSLFATLTILDDATEPATNPIDSPEGFVRQHYHDFLNREADPDGLAFWIDQIASCGADAQCIEIKRINVSAAFYLSIEFQETGYLVERMYKIAYGDAVGTSTLDGPHQFPVPIVRLDDFLPDTREIGLGVVVGQSGWEQVLESNKRLFTERFVQRGRFTTAFPTTMLPSQFVDKLNTNSGGVLSPDERNQLVAELSMDTTRRAQVVRAVAEDSDLVIAERNRAFVLMEYFGYMRRNPNNSPDADHTGYEFWLNKLNEFGGNFVNAEMVKAFIISGEYRQRFGP